MQFPLKIFVLSRQMEGEFRSLCLAHKKSTSVKWFHSVYLLLEEVGKLPFRTLPRAVMVDCSTFDASEIDDFFEKCRQLFEKHRAVEIPFKIFLAGNGSQNIKLDALEYSSISGYSNTLFCEKLIAQALQT